ncbi:DUF6557 family protein [Shimazuella kribbensis]|uniref:DUF6557 family protein n=1 Tax=Shimazuella kribbensis TaxID=139808 RepID=UPI0004031B58|nr:DUF6557 family protein [Shimazuella kribbensis]
MYVVLGTMSLVIFLLFLSIISKKPTNQPKDDDIPTPSIPVLLTDCISEMNWSEVENEFIRLQLEKQRDLINLKKAYEEIIQLSPHKSIKKSFRLYFHINEESGFIDVFAKEDGDFYTEYMIDHEDWCNLLTYQISDKSLRKYPKPTLVCATLFMMTTVGYSSEEILLKKQAHTG